MGIEYYLRVVLKRLWIVVLFGLAGGALGYWQGRNQVPIYRATATLLINPFVSNALVPIDLARQAGSLAGTYARFISTRSFATLVAERLGPGVAPVVVQGALSTHVVASSQFFEIQATSASSEEAKVIANAAAETFVQEQQTRQVGETGATPTGQFRARLRDKLIEELDYYQRQLPGVRTRYAELSTQRGSSRELQDEFQRVGDSLRSMESAAVNVLNNLVLLEGQQAGGSSAVIVDRAFDAEQLPGGGRGNALLLVVVTLTIGIAVVFALEYLDFTVKTPEEVHRLLGVLPLGVVGIIGRDRDDDVSHKLVTISTPRASESEAFRTVRTNLTFSAVERPLQVVGVTSARPSEGKTVVSSNLAIAFAQAGKETILVDADMRRPGVHRAFGAKNQVGLSSVIMSDDGNLDFALQPTPVPGLRLMTSGPLPPNPAELLASPRMDRVMEMLRREADVIIIDTPPVGPVSDAAVLSTKVDGMIQVVQYGTTRRDAVQRAKAAMDQVGGRVVGAVLNRLRASDAGYYYYYSHYDGYDSGDGTKGKRQRRNGRKPE